MSKPLTIITPTYDYPRFKSVVQRAIASIFAQEQHDFEVRHIIVFDGEVNNGFCVENQPPWYRLEVYGTPVTRVWGIAQRNFGMSLVQDGWVWFFDHDNVFYPNAFAVVSDALEVDTGVLITRARHLHANEKLFGKSTDMVIPVDLDHAPRYTDIDSINFIVHSSLIGFGEWQEKWGHDFLFVQNMAAFARASDMQIKRKDCIVGEHS